MINFAREKRLFHVTIQFTGNKTASFLPVGNASSNDVLYRVKFLPESFE